LTLVGSPIGMKGKYLSNVQSAAAAEAATFNWSATPSLFTVVKAGVLVPLSPPPFLRLPSRTGYKLADYHSADIDISAALFVNAMES
jgi:hypothetical protein